MPGRYCSAFQVVAIVILALLLWLGWLRLPGMVSRWAFATLETEWGLVGRVDQINLNLATLRLDVRGLSLAAVGTVDQPFLTVGAAVVDLPWSVVLGTRAVDLIDIVAPVVTIRQSAAGVSNLPVLPSAAPAPSNPSEPWRLSVVSVEGAMVSWVDAAQGLSVATGPVGLQLRPAEDGGSETAGRLTVSSPIRVTANTRETSIEPLDLSLTLAPSALTIDGFVASAPEGRLEAAGELVFGPSTPAIGLEYAFDLALERLALWSAGAVELSGDLRVAGRLDGSPASPHVSVWLQGDRVGWNGLELADLAMSLTFDGGRLTVKEARAGLAGGVVEGTGAVTMTGAGTTGDLRLSWTDLNAELLPAAVWPDRPVGIASRLGGTAEASWSGHEPQDLVVVVVGRHDGPAEAVMPVDGRWRFETGDGAWRLAVNELSAGAVALTGALTGTMPTAWSDMRTVSIDGALQGETRNLERLGIELRALDLTNALAAVDPTGRAFFRVDVSGSVAAPQFSGELNAAGRVLGLHDEMELRAAVSTTDGAWRLDRVDLRLEESALSASATLWMETGDIEGDVTVRIRDLAQLDVVAPVGWRPGGSLDVNGTLGGQWSNPTLDATLSSTDLAVAGQRVKTVDGQVTFGLDNVVVEQLVVEQDKGRLVAAGRVRLATGEYTGSLTGRDLQLAPWRVGEETSQPVGATIDLDLAGSGSFRDPRATGRVVLRDVVYGDVTVDRMEHDLTLDEAGWRLRSAAPALAAEAELTLEPGTPRRYRLEARLIDADLARVVGVAADTGDRVTGTVSVFATAEGDLTDLTASDVVLEVERLGARVTGTPVELATPVRVRSSAAGVRLDTPLDLRVGDTNLTVSGALLRRGDSTMTARLAGDLQDLGVPLSEWAPAERELGDPELSGPLRLDARLTGPFDRPAFTASLVVDGGVVGVAGVAPVTELTLRADYDAAGLTLGQLTGRWQGAALTARGLVPAPVLAAYLPAWLVEPATVRAEPATFTAIVEGIGPDVLTGLVDPETLEELTGEIGLEIALETEQLELSAVHGSLTLSTLDIGAAGVPVVTQQRPTRLTLADERVTVEGLAWQFGGAENALTLGGHVDLGPEPTADLTITGVADLRLLNAFSRAAAMAGGAYLVANVRGTLAEPSIDGVVEITDGEIRVPEPRVLVSDLNGALVFQGTTMRTVDVAGTANGGPIQLDGDIRFPRLRPEGTLALLGSAIPMVLPPGVRTELDADLLLTLASEDAELSGNVTILRGDYREPVNTAGGLRALMESRSDVELLDPEPSVLDTLRLNVQVRTEEELVVNNNYGAGTLAANTRLVGTADRPGVTGRATFGDGGQLFLGGNIFEIETGTIDFVDPDGITPELDISARTRVGTHEITITLEGTAETLTTTLQSNSGLPESDIVSLLLTGRTLDEVGSAPGAVARDQALGLVSGEVLGAAGRSVGLDTVRLDRGTTQGDVRFDSSLVAGETNPGTRLTVGKNLSRQVELVASQSLRESGLVTWIVNYLPRRNVELRLVVDDETDRSYEFRHAVTFGQARARIQPAVSSVEPRVTAVRFSGADGLPESDLRRLVRLETGDRFDFLRWQDSRDRVERALWDLGFQEARVRARRVPDAAADTVALEFEVRAGPRTVFEFRGFEPPTRLRRAMAVAWRTSVFDAFLVDELTQLTRRHVVDGGYLQPVITVEIDDASDDGTVAQKRITVEVDTGPRVRDRTIRFVGHDRLPTPQLATLVTPEREADAWAGGEALVGAVLGTYRAEGFLEATATTRPPVFDAETAKLTIEIVEGPVFHVVELEVEGAERRSSQQVRAEAGVMPGVVYRPGLADRARAAILVAYRSAGFNAARVRVSTRVDAAGEAVTLLATIEEGRRQLLGGVDVQGATDTKPRVVERALQLTPGEPVDPVVWNQARKRLYDTGVFRSVDITALPLADGPGTSVGEDQAVTARVSLEEWPRYRLRYGLQLIDERAPAGETDARGQVGLVADVTRQNLFGHAINLGSAVRYDTVQKAARGFIVFPSFLGRAVRSNLFASRLRETFGSDGAKAVSDRYGLTMEQQITPRAGLTLSYSYNVERDHTFDDDFDPNDPFAFDLTVDIARLNTSVVIERRDDLFDTTRGWFHSSSLEWGVETLGSDLRFLKYVGQQNYFRRLARGVVLGSAARVGLGAGFGQELIPSERFFAGGGNTVRGYPQDGLGPVDFVGASTGGEAFVVLNQEIRFPLWRLLGGVGFLDVGNVFPSVGEVSFRDLRVSTGVGLRADTPVGLVRADYGLPLSRDRNDAMGRWFFSIGQTF